MKDSLEELKIMDKIIDKNGKISMIYSYYREKSQSNLSKTCQFDNQDGKLVVFQRFEKHNQ